MKRILIAALVTLALVAGGVGMGSAVAQETQQAELIVEQPAHVDGSVDIDDSGGERIWHVDGEEIRIWLQSEESENVTRWGIDDGAGDLSYDSSRDRYLFEPEGNGTMSLFWIADTPDGEQRYEATLRVGETDFVHQTAAEAQDQREAASNWQDLEREVASEFPDRETDDVVSSALTKEIFFASPFSTFFADIQGVIIMLTLRPGGLFVLGVILFGFLGSTYGLMRGYHRLRKQTRDEHQLEEEKFQIQKEKSERILNRLDFNERFPDDVSQSMRKHLGENPWLAAKNLMQLWTPLQVKGTVLQLMGQVGYEGRVSRDADGNILDAWVVHRDDEGSDQPALPAATDGGGAIHEQDLTVLDNSDSEHRQVIDCMSGSDLDLTIFDRPERLDFTRVSLPIDNRDIDDADLIQELDPQFPEDFESEAHMAEAMAGLMEMVATHPQHTADTGEVNQSMDLLAFLSEMATTLSEEADFPAAHTYQRVFYELAEQLDAEAKLDKQMGEMREEGIAD